MQTYLEASVSDTKDNRLPLASKFTQGHREQDCGLLRLPALYSTFSLKSLFVEIVLKPNAHALFSLSHVARKTRWGQERVSLAKPFRAHLTLPSLPIKNILRGLGLKLSKGEPSSA